MFLLKHRPPALYINTHKAVYNTEKCINFYVSFNKRARQVPKHEQIFFVSEFWIKYIDGLDAQIFYTYFQWLHIYGVPPLLYTIR
jgi:hypothetical protein